jgi:PAS domain S-box-containing protein
MLDLAYDAIFIQGLPEGVITYWNRGAEDMYGWRASEALGRKPGELLNTVLDRPRAEVVDEVIRTGRWSGSIVQTRRDGTQMMVEARWALETDSSGRPAGILEINRDVTDLHTTMSQLEFANQVSAQLNASLEPEAVLDRLLTLAVAASQATHATVARIEGDEGIVEASQDGHGRRAPAGLRWRISIPAVLQAVRTRKATPSGPNELQYMSEKLKPYMDELNYRLNVPLVMGEEVIGLLIVGRRESAFSREQQTAVERMATHAALALHNSRLFNEAIRQREAAVHSERRLRAALEVGQELATDPELTSLLHNLLARAVSMADADGGAICKLDGDELVVEDVLDLHDPQVGTGHARVQISPAMRNALRTDQPGQADRELLTALFPSRKRLASRPDDQATGLILPLSVVGEQIGLLSIVRSDDSHFSDEQIQGVRQFTAVAALLLRMGRLLEEARQGEEAKREFLNLAGHELRTPLTVLKGYFSLLVDGKFGGAPEAWNHPMSVIKTQLVALERMVESLLVAARADADQMRPSVRQIDLVSEAQAAIARAQPRIELEGAKCSLVAPDGAILALADPEHVALILDNLLHNALDYSLPPADISVEVVDAPQPAILVRDGGIGIPEEARERVFERFVRLAPTVMPTKSGSGLGLYISRNLARGMGGEVVIVDSRLGKGTQIAASFLRPDAEVAELTT